MRKRSAARPRWRPEEDETLEAALCLGESHKVVAGRLQGRTPGAVFRRAKRLGLKHWKGPGNIEVKVRMAPTTVDLVRRRANGAGLTASQWIRNQITKGLAEDVPCT